MPPYEEDTRKVQTAVIGQPGSDWPVFLPFDHDDFDRFMLGRSRDDFYCGTLLGGCGKKLTAKRYLHKKCHFAHRPPVHCRRTQTGEDSADHLYIGQALQRWLRRQGHQKVTVSYPDLGSGPGGAVEVRFGSGTRLIRVQMDRMSLKQWETTRAQFAGGNMRVQWAYGPNSGIAHNEVKAEGHAIRFSCRTESDTRKVYVGTQHRDHSVKLVTLDECHLTDEGIVTPHLTAETPTAPDVDTGMDTANQLAFPLVPGRLAFTASVPAEEQNVTARRLYEADVQPLGSVMTRMRIALPLHSVPPSPHRLNVIESTAHLIPLTDSGTGQPTWFIETSGFSPLPAQSDPRWPDLRPAPEPGRLPSPPKSAAPAEDEALVGFLRGKLMQIARSRGVINWETLIRYKGYAPGDFTPQDRVRLLVAVDRPRTSGKPVLSSLVKLANQAPGPVSRFDEVLADLGWRADLLPEEVRSIWAHQQKTAYDLVRQEAPSGNTAPPERAVPDDSDLISRFRAELERVAFRRSLINWSTLVKLTSARSAGITPSARVRLLVAVDGSYSHARPVLSSLVKLDGQETGPAPFFGQVLRELGWTPGSTLRSPEAAWPTERDRAYALVAKAVSASKNPPPPVRADHALWARLGIKRKTVVKAARRALVSAAQRGVRVSWHTLASAAGVRPEALPDRTRASILIDVDRGAGQDGVLLSSLVVSPGNLPVPYFADVLKHLGRPYSSYPLELSRIRKVEQARVFAAYEGSVNREEA
ncbi:competence protein CoiA family protein [Streptomyces sp. NPDC046831]|uniref:competence protein CoiA family protein n=1 Tax=Streptomyces sp. NPDC046831 TaxID=3154805 RepID=UPI0033D4464A